MNGRLSSLYITKTQPDSTRGRGSTKKYRDRRGNVLKGRHWFVVPCCVYFVLFCLGCPEQLIKLFANSPGQARQDTGQEVSIYRQNRTECLSSFQWSACPYLQCSWSEYDFSQELKEIQIGIYFNTNMLKYFELDLFLFSFLLTKFLKVIFIFVYLCSVRLLG